MKRNEMTGLLRLFCILAALAIVGCEPKSTSTICIEETTYEYQVSPTSPICPWYRFKSASQDKLIAIAQSNCRDVQSKYVEIIGNETVCRGSLGN
jgi:hypothetical protein